MADKGRQRATETNLYKIFMFKSEEFSIYIAVKIPHENKYTVSITSALNCFLILILNYNTPQTLSFDGRDKSLFFRHTSFIFYLSSFSNRQIDTENIL